MEIHKRQNLRYFGRGVAKANLFCPKKFRLGSHGKIFIPFKEYSVTASPASHMNTSKFSVNEEKSCEARSRKPNQLGEALGVSNKQHYITQEGKDLSPISSLLGPQFAR